MSVRLTPAQAKSVSKIANKAKGAVVINDTWRNESPVIAVQVEQTGDVFTVGKRGAIKEV